MDSTASIAPSEAKYIIPESFENASKEFQSTFKQTMIGITEQFKMTLAVPLNVSQDFNPATSPKNYSDKTIAKMIQGMEQEKIKLKGDRIWEMDIIELATKFQRKLKVMLQHGGKEKLEEITDILDTALSTETEPEIVSFLQNVKLNVSIQAKNFEEQKATGSNN